VQSNYVTCGMYGLHAGTGAAEINQRAMQQFDEAEAHFEAERYVDAARGFRRAAEILLEGAEAPRAAELERNRRNAYANMVLAWLNADDADAAREQIEQLAATDPAVAPDLRGVAVRLPSPPRCQLRSAPKPGPDPAP